MTRRYPDERIGGFPRPPREIEDAAGRTLSIRELDPDEVEALYEMYQAFDPEDRAQGIPPVVDSELREWIETVCIDQGHNVVAWDDSRIVGHAMLVPDGTGAVELAVFVLRDYQGAHIGTELCETLLGYAQAAGIERIWLSVEGWNEPAIRLYRNLGFQRSDRDSIEIEMSLRLDTD